VETAFCDGIQNVVAIRAEKQVVEIHAERVIAAMADAVLLGNGSVDQLPQHTMRPTRQWATCHPVAVRMSKSGPQSAAIGIGWRDVSEKLLDRRHVIPPAPANGRAVAPVMGLEVRPALPTRADNMRPALTRTKAAGRAPLQVGRIGLILTPTRATGARQHAAPVVESEPSQNVLPESDTDSESESDRTIEHLLPDTSTIRDDSEYAMSRIRAFESITVSVRADDHRQRDAGQLYHALRQRPLRVTLATLQQRIRFLRNTDDFGRFSL